MRIFNDGEGAVITTAGRIDPKKYLDIPEGEAKRLLGMYATLKDAKAMIGLKEEEVEQDLPPKKKKGDEKEEKEPKEPKDKKDKKDKK